MAAQSPLDSSRTALRATAALAFAHRVTAGKPLNARRNPRETRFSGSVVSHREMRAVLSAAGSEQLAVQPLERGGAAVIGTQAQGPLAPVRDQAARPVDQLSIPEQRDR